jgi:hypothetical protein
MRSMTEGDLRARNRWWRGPSTISLNAHGPQCRVDHAPGMILDCRGQSNPTLRAGEDLQRAFTNTASRSK